MWAPITITGTSSISFRIYRISLNFVASWHATCKRFQWFLCYAVFGIGESLSDDTKNPFVTLIYAMFLGNFHSKMIFINIFLRMLNNAFEIKTNLYLHRKLLFNSELPVYVCKFTFSHKCENYFHRLLFD